MTTPILTFEIDKWMELAKQRSIENEQIQAEIEQIQAEKEKLQAEIEQIQAEIEKLQTEKEQIQTEKEQIQAEKEILEAITKHALQGDGAEDISKEFDLSLSYLLTLRKK